MEKQKVIVYVDGFNFYYGLKGDPKWKRYYWLDSESGGRSLIFLEPKTWMWQPASLPHPFGSCKRAPCL